MGYTYCTGHFDVTGLSSGDAELFKKAWNYCTSDGDGVRELLGKMPKSEFSEFLVNAQRLQQILGEAAKLMDVAEVMCEDDELSIALTHYDGTPTLPVLDQLNIAVNTIHLWDTDTEFSGQIWTTQESGDISKARMYRLHGKRVSEYSLGIKTDCECHEGKPWGQCFTVFGYTVGGNGNVRAEGADAESPGKAWSEQVVISDGGVEAAVNKAIWNRIEELGHDSEDEMIVAVVKGWVDEEYISKRHSHFVVNGGQVPTRKEGD